jgi:hypothetical protein
MLPRRTARLATRLLARSNQTLAARTPRPAFDGFATHTADCLIDLEHGDYAE